MKTTTLIICIIICSIVNGFGQNDVLVLKKKMNGKEKIIREGKRIKTITNSDRILKGKFEIINDSSLVIKSDTLDVSDIVKIRTKSIASYITGGLLTGGGGLITTLGSLLVSQASSEGFMLAFFYVVIGLPVIGVGVMTTIGGVLVLTIGKIYTNKKWDFGIRYVLIT
jgi:hypothetical protein